MSLGTLEKKKGGFRFETIDGKEHLYELEADETLPSLSNYDVYPSEAF
jgi:hypothetical protein